MQTKKRMSVNRDNILEQAKREDERSNLKQHADKMLRGFENFNDFSANRAIWELVQNACDLSKECKVEVNYNNTGIKFSHNGKPFTTKSLISLIKQVSGKYGDAEEISEVGKYGTGFITTHTFGRTFKINSVLQADSVFFKLHDFEINRNPKKWEELSDNIYDQREEVYKIIQDGEIVEKPDVFSTSFSYIPQTEQEKKYITDSRLDLDEYAPIVLTINNRLKEFVIIDETGETTSFKQKSKEVVTNEANIPLYKTCIEKNGEEKTYYSLIDTEYEIEIILPINERLETFEFGERVARLFLYYPLVGSEDFGFNFVFNCQKFLPTEPRDGIHLKSNKDQLKEQEEENRRIVDKASELIFSFLKSNILKVSNPLLFSKINFNRNTDNNLLNEYFEELQDIWLEVFDSLPFVETKDGFKAISECKFFHSELIDCDSIFDEVYDLTSKFYDNIPIKDSILLWSRFANEWGNESTDFITHVNIVGEISELNLQEFNKDTLLKYYQYLLDNDKKVYFSDYSLLPNQDGVFQSQSHLLNPENITSTLLDIGKVLIPDTIERFIHSDFKFDFTFETFNRKNFSSRVKDSLDESNLVDNICLPLEHNEDDYVEDLSESDSTIEYNYLENLIKYFKLNSNLNAQSKPSQLIKIISKYYGFDSQLIYLDNLSNKEENLEVRSSRKYLVRIFFNTLVNHTNDWVKNNLGYLYRICECYDDSYKEVYDSAEIYPNQLNTLCDNKLKRVKDLSEEIIKIYDTVLKTEIKSQITYPDFNKFIDKEQFVNNKYLTTQIEEVFFESDINDINEHPFKDEILSIISKLREKFYSDLFPRLDDKKANLMLDVVTNESTKDDIFSIVTLKEDQIKKLGALVKEDNFESLLNKAADVLEQEKEKKADFRHKYEIGTNVEKLIREKLSSELQERVSFHNEEELEAKDIQGGQDIVIMIDDEPFYLIEVKSRWKSENSVSMSKLQLQRAVEENGRYALCSVDISRYEGTTDRYQLPIEEIIPLTKFVEEIGGKIKPLIQENLKAEENPEELIHLIDYRGIIPQDTIKVGSSFTSFIDTLCNKIKAQ